MSRAICILALASILVVTTGCAMCQNPFDDTSPAYGGRCGDASEGCTDCVNSTYMSPPVPMTVVPQNAVINGVPVPAPSLAPR